jgi:hypothetical protein
MLENTRILSIYLARVRKVCSSNKIYPNDNNSATYKLGSKLRHYFVVEWIDRPNMTSLIKDGGKNSYLSY